MSHLPNLWPAMTRSFFSLLFCLVFIASASAADKERGRFMFQTCSACHGESGEGKTIGTLRLPPIAGLSAWYVETQLKNFQNGVRGAHPADTKGLLMRPMSRLLRTEDDVKAVAAHIASLPRSKSAVTVKGDPEAGKFYYDQVCVSCHGDKFQGSPNPEIKAPSQKPLADWYMLEQLEKFAKGVRGAHPKDVEGLKMSPIMKMFPQVAEAKGSTADQALKDVVAYIYSKRDE